MQNSFTSGLVRKVVTSEQTYLLVVAPIGPNEKLMPFSEYRYVPMRFLENDVARQISLVSEQHNVQIMGIVSKEMVLGMQAAMGSFGYLVIAAPIGGDLKVLPSNEYQYVPFSCDRDELNLAVSMISKQHEIQALGIISKEMVLGMLKTMENFEKGV